MRKKVLSAVLLITNFCLLVAIVILVIKVVARGEKKEEPVISANEVVTSVSDDSASANDIQVVDAQYERILIAIPNVTNSVNVRSGPSVDYDRIGSAYSDCEYEVYEIQSNGWTKLSYDGQVGYISSEYLCYQFKLDYGNDSYTYETVTDEELEEYMTE